MWYWWWNFWSKQKLEAAMVAELVIVKVEVMMMVLPGQSGK